MAGTPKKAALRREISARGGIEAVLARIAAGVTITDMAREYKVSRAQLSIWIGKHAPREVIDAARREGAGALADQTLEIADSATHDNDRAARLRIDTRRWLSSKMDPETYGEQRGPLVELNLSTLHLDALRKVEAAVRSGERLLPGDSD